MPSAVCSVIEFGAWDNGTGMMWAGPNGYDLRSMCGRLGTGDLRLKAARIQADLFRCYPRDVESAVPLWVSFVSMMFDNGVTTFIKLENDILVDLNPSFILSIRRAWAAHIPPGIKMTASSHGFDVTFERV